MAISCRRRAAGATRGVHYHRASGTLVSCTMTTSATSPARESRDSVVIRFAGDSGDGMQVTGGRFTVETALAGNDLTTFPDYPAEIRAPAGTTYGVSAFQIHFGAVDVMTPGDQVDVLVAMNPAALKVDLKDLRIGGTVVVDTGAFTERNLAKAGFTSHPLDDGSLAPYQVLNLDITERTLDAVKDFGLHTREAHRCRNMWALGLMLWMYGRDRDVTVAWLKQKFAGKPEIAQANVAALNAGHAFGETAEMSEYGVGYTVRRPLDGDADQSGAIGSVPGSAWPQRGRAARRARRGHCDRLLRCRHGGGPPRDHLHDARGPALGRFSGPRRRAVAHPRLGPAAALPGPVPHGPRGVPSLPAGPEDPLAAVGAARDARARAPDRRAREGLRHGSHLVRPREPRAHDAHPGGEDRRDRERHPAPDRGAGGGPRCHRRRGMGLDLRRHPPGGAPGAAGRNRRVARPSPLPESLPP